VSRLWRSRGALWLATLVIPAVIASACDSDQVVAETSSPATTNAPTTATPVTTTTTAAPETTTTSGPDRSYGGEVVVASAQEPPTLNSFAPGGDETIVSIIGQSYWAGVQEIDGYTLELVPELVTELPTVANGGAVVNDDSTMTVRYQIRDEARWSDGTPITGEDFQFTLETILDPDVRVEKTTYEDIIATQVGPKTFSYTLAKPTALYELIFDQIIPKHAVEGTDFNNDWNEKMWPSAGPFMFESWDKGERIRVVRNDNYWKVDPDTGQELPYLDSVEFRFVPEADLLTVFRGREVDIIQPPATLESMEALQALEPEGAAVEVLRGPLWEHLSFQFGPGRLERNPNSANESLNFRKGVAYAIDYDLIVDEILGGQTERLTSFLDTVTPSIATDAWSQYTYDPAKAQEYFNAAKDELGLDNLSIVFTTTSNIPTRVRLSELLADMFADAGIDYENQLEVSQVFFDETLNNGLWDMGLWAWRGSPGFSGAISLYNRFDPESTAPSGFNYYRWGTEDSVVIDENTERFAEIRRELNESVDPDVLVPLMQEGEQILADQVVIIPLYARPEMAAVWADEVGGFKHNSTPATYAWNIEQWYRVDL
jgi:peptide/nickel transport system substrate-binding protein